MIASMQAVIKQLRIATIFNTIEGYELELQRNIEFLAQRNFEIKSQLGAFSFKLALIFCSQSKGK